MQQQEYKIKAANENSAQFRALLDCGSQVNIVSEQVNLGVSTSIASLCIDTKRFSQDEQQCESFFKTSESNEGLLVVKMLFHEKPSALWDSKIPQP